MLILHKWNQMIWLIIFSLLKLECTLRPLVYPGDDDAELMLADTATGQAQDLPDEDRELFIGLAIYQQECPDFKHIFQYLLIARCQRTRSWREL